MKEKPVRVLCVDSSDRRREKLTFALENMGVEVWAARDLRDALAMVARLTPDALIVDEASTHRRQMEWEMLTSLDLRVPALVHSSPANATAWPSLAGDFGVIRTQDPEVIVAILSLLLGSRGQIIPSPTPKQAA